MAGLKPKLDKIVDRLKSELAAIRTGRATPAMVEDLAVDYFGVKTPLKALASISVPDPKTLVIQTWNKNALQSVEKAIRESSLGLNPAVDKDIIRLNIPQLTEEKRKEFLKIIGRHAEDARINVRKEREDALKDVDRREKAGEISEDEKFRQRAEVQKDVDEVNKRMEEMAAAKEKEVMTV